MPPPVFHALVIVLAALIAMTPALMVGTSVLQFAPLPPDYRPLVRFLYVIGFLAPTVWIVFVGAVVLLLFKGETRRNLGIPRRLLAGLLILSAVSVIAGPWIMDLRMIGVRRMIQNAEPLIRAVESYRASTGEYPRQLQDLVPAHINAIPHTDAVGYPDFEYARAGQDSPFKAYEISVKTPAGGFTFDQLVYWPEHSYPAHMYGGEIERIGSWAYVHE
jgi:hypothetical protein